MRRGRWLGLVREQPLWEVATSLSDKADTAQGTDLRDRAKSRGFLLHFGTCELKFKSRLDHCLAF